MASSVTAVRLAGEHVDEFNGHRAGRLVEIDVADGPVDAAIVTSPDGDNGSDAPAVHSGSA